MFFIIFNRHLYKNKLLYLLKNSKNIRIMSIQDYHRRGEWMFESMGGNVDNGKYELLIIDVKWVVFKYLLKYNRIPEVTDIIGYITSIIEFLGSNRTVIYMPTQKTRNCYYALLEESLRYSTGENYHILRPHSNLMVSLYESLSNLNNDNIFTVKRRYIFNENEEIINSMKSFLETEEGSVMVYTMSADFFLYSVTLNSDRIYFYNGEKQYCTKNVTEYFIDQGINLADNGQRLRFFHASILFGNAYFPVHYECHVYMITNYKFQFFINLVKEIVNSDKYIIIQNGSSGQTLLDYNSEFIYNSIHTIMTKLDITMFNMYFDMLNIYGDNYKFLLETWKIPDMNNIFGSHDLFVNNVYNGDNIEFHIPSLANTLGFLYIATISSYSKLSFDLSSINVYFDSSIYSVYYLDKYPMIDYPLDIRRDSYSETIYILRTNSRKYILQYLNHNLFKDSQRKILSDMANIQSNEKAGALERMNFIEESHSLNKAGGYNDPLTHAGDKHRKFIKLYLPFLPLVMKFIKDHK